MGTNGIDTDVQKEKYFQYPEYTHIGNMYYLTEGLPATHELSVRSRYLARYGTLDGLPLQYRTRHDLNGDRYVDEHHDFSSLG